MQELVLRVASLRRGIRQLYLLNGAGRLLLAAALLAAFLFAVDYFLILPAAARAILFCLSLAGIVLVFTRYVSFPLRKPISDDALVIEVERANPGLHDLFISALQLSRRDDDLSRKVASKAMIEATIDGALDQMERLSFGSILNPKKPLLSFAAGAGASVLVLLAGVVFPEGANIFLNRVWGGPSRWPPKTLLFVESPQSSRTRLSLGDDLVVRVRVEKRIPSRMWLDFEFPDSGETGEVRMVKTGEDTFEYPFTRLVSRVRFRIQGGDAATDEYEVGVLEPPRIASISVWMTPPEYTKVPGTPQATPLRDGNIVAPSGTRIKVRIVSSKELREARLTFQGAESSSAMSLVDPATAEASFDVVRNDRFSIDLTDTEGLTNRTPSVFSVRAERDTRPRITVSKPETTSFWITPQASIPFVFKVDDDYGVRSAEILVGRGTREQDMKGMVLEPAAGQESGPYGPKSAEYTSLLEFQTLEVGGDDGTRLVSEGDLVRVRIVASDFSEPVPNQAPSAVYKFTVVSKSKLENMVEERMLQLKDQLRRARDEQGKVMDSLDQLKGVLILEEVWDSGDREKLVGCQNAQRAVGQRLATAAREFDRILSIVQMNRLGDPDYQRKIEEMGAITDHLGSERSPEAIAGMEAARAAPAKDEQSRGLSESMKVQSDIVHALDELLERMERWEDYNEVIKILREIRDRQEGVYEETLDEAKGREQGKDK